MHGNVGRARGAAVIVALTAAGVVPVLLLTKISDRPGDVLRSAELVVNALILSAAVSTYVYWRMSGAALTREPGTRLAGWLTVGLTGAGLFGLVQSSMIDVNRTGPKSWALVGQLVLTAALVLIARLSDRAEVPGDPALVGALGGLAISVGTALAAAYAPPLTFSPATTQLLDMLVMLAGLLLAVTVLQRDEIPSPVRRRLALATILLMSAHALGYSQPGSHYVVVVVAVIIDLQGAVLLCATIHSLLRGSLLQQQREVVELHETLARVRANVLEDRELLHEIGSTVAGIVTASRVVRDERRLSPQRRARLEHMLDAELARINRLLDSRAPALSQLFDVDEVVERIVISHQERGLDVRWTPSHAEAIGNPDNLAEVVNILLENARRHGGGSVRVEVSTADGYVEVACSDNGPGIAAEVRPQLFTSGVRGPGSPGQGLGLAIAKRLMCERGGSLELVESSHRGALFVARLPMNESAHVTSGNVA
jgi:signal transduction histidine kinase